MFEELKRILLVQAGQIAHVGSDEAAEAFIGFQSENGAEPYNNDDPARVKLDRFCAREYLDLAYDFAFQVGRYWHFDEYHAHKLFVFMAGVTPHGSGGEQSPYLEEGSLCRHTAEMAQARWQLEERDNDLTIRHLALLAGMTEPAVRNSLSVEGIRTRGKPAGLDPDSALAWLRGRRGFISTREKEGREEAWALHARSLLAADRFLEGFRAILQDCGIPEGELAAKAQVAPDFVAGLLTGRPALEIEALSRIGAVLGLDVPHFVGLAVEVALRARHDER
jgi:hypothetical protein